MDGEQLSRLLGGPDADDVVQTLGRIRSEAEIAPATRARIAELSIACMPDGLYDANFMNSCQQGCTTADCPSRCRCLLDKLRAGMDPATGTKWLMQNLEQAEPTVAGQARTEAAVAACSAAAM